MSFFNNQVGIRVEGNGNQVSGNKIINNNQQHYHHNNRRGNSGDGRGEVAGIIFVTLTIIWLFHKYANEIYFYIVVGALFSITPILIVFPFLRSNESLYKAGSAIMLSLMAFILADYGVGMLSPEIIKVGQSAENGWVFWQSLSKYGRYSAISNLMGALSVSAAVLLSIFSGLAMLWFSFVEQDVEYVVNNFNMKRFGVFMAILLIMAWLLMSETLLKLIL